MTPQVKSQILGISLSIVTAFGCIAYGKLVKSCSYFTVGFLVSLSYLPFWLTSLFFVDTIKEDLVQLTRNKCNLCIFLISGLTGPLWYMIARNQNVLVGATYEMKYIVIMAIIYLFVGDTQPSWNTFIGIALACLSVYFISK